jgi:S1-C subfamily serine protease
MLRLRAGWEGAWRPAAVLAALVLLMVCAGPLAAPAAAQEKLVPPSRDKVLFSFASIVKLTTPAVVNVYVREKTRAFVSPYYDEYRRYYSDMPEERMQKSLGSGVIVSADGAVVTNAHVIKVAGRAEISLVLHDRRELNAKVLLADEKSDIAVLRIEVGDGRFPRPEFTDSDAAEVGDMVLAIGKPAFWPRSYALLLPARRCKSCAFPVAYVSAGKERRNCCYKHGEARKYTQVCLKKLAQLESPK